MRPNLIAWLLLTCFPSSALAGDDASGPIRYEVDLSQKCDQYRMTRADKEWARRVTGREKPEGQVKLFVRTSLPLKVDDVAVTGSVYQCLGSPQFFYVVNGDAMIRLPTDEEKKLKKNSSYIYSPGVGGFEMFRSKSGNFIVTLNFQAGGVPFLSGSTADIAHVRWNGDSGNRFRQH